MDKSQFRNKNKEDQNKVSLPKNRNTIALMKKT